MRPTDENQSGSRRPNLMSPSRRTTGEINILAMLDGRAPGRRLLAGRAVVWYGAAGVLACALLVALAWLVRGATPPHDGTQAAQAAQASARQAEPARSMAPVPDSGQANDARDSIPVAVPGMRTTLAAESSVSVPAPDMAASPDAAGPARGAVIIDLPQPAPAMASAVPVRTPAHHASTHPATPSIPSARPQPALRTSSALVHADPAPPRQKRPPGTARTTPSTATVDTDVALISAILQHTGPRNEAAEGAGAAACTDKPCGPRMPPRQ